MANRLARETSPYLLQHAHNPVDWYPWGEEALARARDEDKPILLSIGYASCHWCHVMERESFEDPETASMMNEHFVSIKVDREERPDLDSVYMRGVQALSGHGGWPLTAFLTPDGRMFYGGTYFPPRPGRGLPSFRQVLAAVADAFGTRRDEVERGSDQLLEVLKQTLPPPDGAGASTSLLDDAGPGVLDHAYQFLLGQFDPLHGGFGPPPKFPQPMILELLLRHFLRSGEDQALDMVLQTLRAMARGGIRDHLGGGFHRYSVDARWLVPHFEKMLYDNALLAQVYLHAFQATGDGECLEAATMTLDYMLADLKAPEGGFYCSRDADSQGEEGLFYLWRTQEVDEILGTTHGPLFRRAYGLTEGGNFEGRNILHLPRSLDAFAGEAQLTPEEASRRLAEARGALLEVRGEREPPFRDEKVLTAWNAFALRALAEAGAVLHRADYLEAARANASFLLGALRRNGRLFRSWKDGQAHVSGFLDDHAALGNALLTLHETTLEVRWLEEGLTMVEAILDAFWDEEAGVFFDSARDAETLVVRPRDVTDNATPSGTSLAVELLLRSGHLLGNEGYRVKAARALAGELTALRRVPSAFAHLLEGLSAYLDPWLEVTLVGTEGDPLLPALLLAAHHPFLPNRVVVGGDPSLLPPLPLLEGREPREGRATAYVCRNRVCGAPLCDPEALIRELKGVAP